MLVQRTVVWSWFLVDIDCADGKDCHSHSKLLGTCYIRRFVLLFPQSDLLIHIAGVE
jgi:hypothetical protein